MNIGAVIIGDEIMSGKRQDQHFRYLQQTLAKRGLELSWTIIVGDDNQQLERALRYSFAGDDLVFSFGGIGATPDDRTRQTVAKIAGVALKPHPDAVAEIEAEYGDIAYPNRILMSYLPSGSRIIPNPVNRVPGFSLFHHHFMPGFPQMAWPMIEWLLDTHYSHLKNLAPESEQIILVQHARESDFIDVMIEIDKNYPQLRLSSLPHIGHTPHIELSLRGPELAVFEAMAILKKAIKATGLSWSDQLTKK